MSEREMAVRLLKDWLRRMEAGDEAAIEKSAHMMKELARRLPEEEPDDPMTFVARQVLAIERSMKS